MEATDGVLHVELVLNAKRNLVGAPHQKKVVRHFAGHDRARRGSVACEKLRLRLTVTIRESAIKTARLLFSQIEELLEGVFHNRRPRVRTFGEHDAPARFRQVLGVGAFGEAIVRGPAESVRELSSELRVDALATRHRGQVTRFERWQEIVAARTVDAVEHETPTHESSSIPAARLFRGSKKVAALISGLNPIWAR